MSTYGGWAPYCGLTSVGDVYVFFILILWFWKIHILISLYSHKSCINFVKMTSLSPTIQCLYWYPFIFASTNRRSPMSTPLGRITPVCLRTWSPSDKYHIFAAVIPYIISIQSVLYLLFSVPEIHTKKSFKQDYNPFGGIMCNCIQGLIQYFLFGV